MNGTPVDLSAFVGVIDNALGVTEEKAEAKGLHLPAQYASGIDANTGQIIISSSQTKEVAISGLVNAESEAETSEGNFGKIGFRGILKKVMILLIVILAQMIGTAAGIEEVRDLVVGFYIANEGISVLENAGRMNVPVCKNFTKYLEQLRG